MQLKGISVGDIIKSNNYGEFEIIGIENSRKVTVKFINTNFTKSVDSRVIRKGVVKDNSLARYGSGAVLDVTGKGVGEDEIQSLWSSMIFRCYSEAQHKTRPRYKNCEVSENFKSFSFFKAWCKTQVGFNVKGYALDKDLLFKGNTLYSENTCVFVPREVNNALEKANKSRGNLPIGVCFDKSRSKFKVAMKCYGKTKFLGRYDSIENAFNSYKVAKEDYLKELADKWKGKIDTRAYEALMSYVVEVTD